MTSVSTNRSQPGEWLLRRAQRYFEQPDLEILIQPIVADIQHEYVAARQDPIARSLILLRGYWSFWKTIGLHLVLGKEGNMRIIKFIVTNLLSFVIFMVISIFLIRLGSRITPDGWVGPDTGQLLGCLIGAFVALAFRAHLTAYFLAGMIAFSASERVVHAYYGIQAAQGAETHFAVMGAALLGVVFGALLTLRSGTAADQIGTHRSAAH